MINSHNDQLI